MKLLRLLGLPLVAAVLATTGCSAADEPSAAPPSPSPSPSASHHDHHNMPPAGPIRCPPPPR